MASRKMNEDVAYARNTESGCKPLRTWSGTNLLLHLPSYVQDWNLSIPKILELSLQRNLNNCNLKWKKWKISEKKDGLIFLMAGDIIVILF